jgi:hypothetical protein
MIVAQNWAPTGAVWYFDQTHYFLPLVDYYRVESIGDTLIAGINCKNLQKNTQTCDLRPIQEYMYENNSQVFFWENDLQQFQMLYDFNASQGSSWVIRLSEMSQTIDTMQVDVDSTSITTINGFSKNVLYLNFHHLPNSGGGMFGNRVEVIEGIGSTDAMFPWQFGACDGNWAGEIRCYSDNTIGFIDFDTAHACDYIITVIEESIFNSKIQIFPNPSSSEVFIQYAAGNNRTADFILSDVYGKNILSGELKSGLNTIDVSTLASGVYYVRIHSTEGIVTKKILKL